MANRRMIGKSISVSEQVNELSDFAALLFSWLIPHSDDYGVIPGSPRKIKALVVPMRKQSAEQVDAALKEMQSVGLVWRYIYKGSEYTQFCKFDEHQEGLHKRTTSKNPLYLEILGDIENFRELPGNSRLIEPNLIEPKRKEEKGICVHDKIVDLYHQYCPTLPKIKVTSDKRKRAISELMKKFDLEKFKQVFQNAGDSDFLLGKKGDWSADFDFFLREDKFIKTLEGGFANKQDQNTVKPEPQPLPPPKKLADELPPADQVWPEIEEAIQSGIEVCFSQPIYSTVVTQLGFDNLCQMDRADAKKQFCALYERILKKF